MIRWTYRKATSRPKRTLSLAVLGVIAVLGMASVVSASTPPFTVSAAPSTQTINSGSAASYAVTLSPIGGFTGTVTLTAGSLPKGTSASWTVGVTTTSGSSVQVTVPPGSRGVSATLTIVGGQPTAGTYSPTVTAKSGSASTSASMTLVVVNQNAANFSLSVSPSAQTVVQGLPSASTVSITRSNTSAAVTLGPVTGLPGATATFTPSSTTTGSTVAMVISVPSSTSPGLYTLTLTGTAATSPASTRFAAFTLLVLGATATTVSAPAADATNVAIAATSISSTLSGATSGATGTISFKVFGPQSSPPITCLIGGTPVGSAAVSGNGTYHPSAGYTPTTAGTYWWYASYSGDLYDSASNSTCASGMTSTVVKNATTATAAAPATGTATVAITPTAISSTLAGGTTSPLVTGAITFKVFGPQSTAPTSCTTGGTPVGTSTTVSGNGVYHPSAGYTPSVGGTYWWYASYSGDTYNSPSTSPCGSGMASTVVADFSLAASPSSQTALTGGTTDDSAIYTATVTPLGGFSGSVSLTLPTGLPTGASASFNPTSTSSTSTLTIDVGTNVTPGTYALTVRGTATINGNTVTRTTQVTLVVNPSSPFNISGDVPNPLYPGAPAQSFPVKLTNPNSFPITVKSLGSVGVQAVGAPSCLPSWFVITLPTVPAAGIVVAANGGSVTLTATAQMLDPNTPQDACKGKQLTLSYTGSYTK